MNRTLRELIVIAAAWLGAATLASAQQFPSKVVKITTPHSSGVAATVMMRLVAEKLSKIWGQPVIVESKPGASGFIAIAAVKNSEPDGHNLLVVVNSHMAINPALYKEKLPYRPDKDFVPVAMVLDTPFFVTVSASGPVQSLPSLVTAARAEPGKVSYGSSYVGSSSHLGAAELEQLSGTKMIHVPFKDQSQMYFAIANGDITWAFSTLGAALPLINAGRIKPIAIAAKERLKARPDVPTIEEAGGPKGLVVNAWVALVAPVGIKTEVVRKINADVNKVLADADVLERMKTFGFEPLPGSPEQFAEVIRSDTKKYTELVRRTGASAD